MTEISASFDNNQNRDLSSGPSWPLGVSDTAAHTLYSLKERATSQWYDLALKLIEAEGLLQHSPILSLTILQKLATRDDDLVSATGVTELLEFGARKAISPVRILQAVWDEIHENGCLRPEEALRRAEYHQLSAQACGQDPAAEVYISDCWRTLNKLPYNDICLAIASELFSCAQSVPFPNRAYPQISERVALIGSNSRSDAELVLFAQIVSACKDHGEFIDPAVNALAHIQSIFREVADSAAVSFYQSFADTIKAQVYANQSCSSIVSSVLTCSELAQHGFSVRAIRRGFAILSDAATLELNPQPSAVLPSVVIASHRLAHQQNLHTLILQMRGGLFSGPEEFANAIKEVGVHAASEILVRPDQRTPYVTAWYNLHTEFAAGHVTHIAMGHGAKLARAQWQAQLETLDRNQIARVGALARDLEIHHGFSALAVEAMLPPHSTRSLLHRFASEHGISQLKCISPAGQAPEYALIVRGLVPDRLFVANGKGWNRFDAYKHAWPNYAPTINFLAEPTFIFARGYMLVVPSDRATNGLLWANDHYANPRGILAFEAHRQDLFDIFFNNALEPSGASLEQVLRYCQTNRGIQQLRASEISRQTNHINRPSGHHLLDFVDLFRIGYSQWKKGQTLPAMQTEKQGKDPAAAPLPDADGTFLSEAAALTNDHAARMLLEAKGWHSLHARGNQVPMDKFPLLVVTDTFNWASLPNVYGILDTQDMKLRVGNRAIAMVDEAGQLDISAYSDWASIVLPLALDRPNNFRELRFVQRSILRGHYDVK